MRCSIAGFTVLSLVLSNLGLAQAETGTGSAAEVSVAPIQLSEYNPLKVKNVGPARAKGIVYFIDGLDSNNRTRDDYHATYPYIYGLNTRHGWDVIAAKFPNSQRYSFRSIPGSSEYLLARLAELRARGYRKIVLAGQSWGAWVTVDVARREGAQKAVDAILLTAPANYGMREWDGKPNPYFVLNKSEYLEKLKTIRVPTIATFFKDDEFDPGGRGPITRQILAANDVPAVVIDQPSDLIGHGAGWQPQFDYVYGDCIAAFLAQPKDGSCDGTAAPSMSDIRSVKTEKDVIAGGGAPVSLKDINNKTFIVISPRGHVTVEQYGTVTAKVLTDTSTYTAQMRSKGQEICFGFACSRYYRLKDGSLIGFGSDGNWTSKMVTAD